MQVENKTKYTLIFPVNPYRVVSIRPGETGDVDEGLVEVWSNTNQGKRFLDLKIVKLGTSTLEVPNFTPDTPDVPEDLSEADVLLKEKASDLVLKVTGLEDPNVLEELYEKEHRSTVLAAIETRLEELTEA